MKHFLSITNLTILVLLSICCFLFIIYNKSLDNRDLYEKWFNACESNYAAVVSNHMKNEMNLQKASIEVFDNNLRIKDKNNNEMHLSNIISDTILIMLYSNGDCPSCLESHLKLLNDHIAETKLKSAILSSTNFQSDVVKFVRMNNLSSPFYSFNKDLLKSSLSKTIGLVIFILTPEGKIFLPFCPQQGFPELTTSYINLAKTFLNGN